MERLRRGERRERNDREEGTVLEERGRSARKKAKRKQQLRIVPRLFVLQRKNRRDSVLLLLLLFVSFEVRRISSVNSGFLYPLSVVQDEV